MICSFPWIIFYFYNPIDKTFIFPNEIHVNDWHKELEYLRVLKESWIQQVLPFYVPNFGELFGSGDLQSFLAMPIYTLSVQSFLLIYLDPMHFHIINHFLLISLGLWGCYLLKAELKLNFIPFVFLLITFSLYGGFISKISAYGPSQLGYYFSPFVIYIIFWLSRQENKLSLKEEFSVSILLSLSLAGIIFQGSLHYFVEWITFLIFWGIFNLKYLRLLAISALVTILLSAVRIFPAAVQNSTGGNLREIGGYGFNPEFFLQTFISIRGITDFPAFAWWENSNYVSIFGFIMIFIFAFFIYFFKKKDLLKINNLLFPLAIIFIISFSNFRAILVPDFIPLLNIESITTRYMFIPCLFLISIASFNFDKFYKKLRKRKTKVIIWLMLTAHIIFLYVNVYVWSLQKIQQELYSYGQEELLSSLNAIKTQLFISNQAQEGLYIDSFYYGLVITSITLALIIIFLLLSKLKRN